jgi:hypothetical protein
MRAPLVLAVMVGCFQFESPASRSPLKEKLAPLTEHDLESAVRSCLEKDGWKVDDVPSQHGAIEVLHAKKRQEDTSLYLYPEGTVPRITGLAAVDDALWTCLRTPPP